MKRRNLLISSADVEFLLNKMCEAGLQLYDKNGFKIEEDMIVEKSQAQESFIGLAKTMTTERIMFLLKNDALNGIFL